MGPYCHTHNYSSLLIHYMLTGTVSKKTMLTGPDGGGAVSAPRRRIKCCRQCAKMGWTFLLKKKNGPELFTTLTTICMGPLVAGRKWREKEDWSLSLPKNNTIIGNNILMLKFVFSNHEFKELVHEHLALFIYLLIYV